MTKEKFNEQVDIQMTNIRLADYFYCAGAYEYDMVKVMINEFKLIISNLEDVCNVYEMENKVK